MIPSSISKEKYYYEEARRSLRQGNVHQAVDFFCEARVLSLNVKGFDSAVPWGLAPQNVFKSVSYWFRPQVFKKLAGIVPSQEEEVRLSFAEYSLGLQNRYELQEQLSFILSGTNYHYVFLEELSPEKFSQSELTFFEIFIHTEIIRKTNRLLLEADIFHFGENHLRFWHGILDGKETESSRLRIGFVKSLKEWKEYQPDELRGYDEDGLPPLVPLDRCQTFAVTLDFFTSEEQEKIKQSKRILRGRHNLIYAQNHLEMSETI
ncbi:MAG: hypothetical protein AB1393_12790 [Candidatus Edwardsbacteria bacterium]